MKKLLLFAAVAGLGLVSASPPKGPDTGEREARRYPPCSRTVTDRCIQLHERGVRAPRHREHHARGDDGAHRGHADHRGHRERHARGDGAHDDHRGHREHHADRGHREHGAADHRPARRVAMASRASRVVGCRCQPRRPVAQRVRRAGERG
jgi:hypothetical protein